MTEERGGYSAGELVGRRASEIALGNKTYIVQEATYVRTRRFWPLLSGQLDPIAEAMESNKDLGKESDIADFAALIPVVQRVLLDAPVAMMDAICAYDAAIEADRAEIEENATDRQIVGAVMAMMGMSDPFGARSIVRRGLARLAPSSSSPPASGE